MTVNIVVIHTVLFAVLFLFARPGVAVAEVLRELYIAEVQVENRLRSARLEASGRALLQVLTRLTGKNWLSESSEIQEALQDGSLYMRSYRYRSDLSPEGEELTWLSVNFEPRLVEGLLRRSGLALWPANRPNVIVWAVHRDEELSMVSPESNPELNRLANDYASRHGLPVRLPLMDLEDHRRLDAEDVMRSRRRDLWKASERYLADSILSGSFGSIGGHMWVGRWTYLYGEEVWNFAVSCPVMVDCMRMAFDAVLDFLASRQSLPAEESAPAVLHLEVNGIESFADYIQTLNYLRGLEQLREVQPVRLREDQVLFNIDSRADTQSLREAIALDRRLEEWDGVDTAATDMDLTESVQRYSLPARR